MYFLIQFTPAWGEVEFSDVAILGEDAQFGDVAEALALIVEQELSPVDDPQGRPHFQVIDPAKFGGVGEVQQLAICRGELLIGDACWCSSCHEHVNLCDAHGCRPKLRYEHRV